MIWLKNMRRLIGMSDSEYPPKGLCEQRVKEGARHDSWGSSSGFTIIEILVVVVILTIVALTAVPMLSSAGSMQLRAAANMIAADLEYAKSMAISRGQNYAVVFDQNLERYQIEDQNFNVIPHPVKKGFNYVVDFRNDGRLSKVDIVSASFGIATDVVFDSLGSPLQGGTVTLQASGATATISVEPITGYISIQ